MMRRLLLLPLAAAALVSAGAEPKSDAPQRVVIPFDFESKFDNGRYGRMIGDLVWQKLQRQGGFVLPESMADVRDWCERSRTLPGPDTPLARMKEIVREGNAGDVAIWGKVERVDPEGDVYDLWIYVADFTTDPPRMIYEKKARTRTVSDIPHTYVKEALEKLYGRSLDRPEAPPDPLAEERWRTGPNLVKGGDFEQGRTAPLGWTDPLPEHVRWVSEPGARPANRVLRFSFPAAVAETTGVLYYSDYFAVEPGATYRFRCRWRSDGPAVKVFVKCYAEVRGRFSKPGDPAVTQRREVFRSQQNLKGPAGTWNVQTEDFTPGHAQYPPRWGRVMLYAYYPAGTVEWDDVVVKQIAPAPK
jgi:hypothetical protein